MDLRKTFPVRVTHLKDQFPIKKTRLLKETFPWKSRKGGTGSGFIDQSSREIAQPLIIPPVPSFSTSRGPITVNQSLNTSPGLDVSFSGYGSFILTNTTDDTTYTNQEWKVRHVQSDTYLLTGIHTTYVIIPNLQATEMQSWEIEMTAFFRGTEGKAYQIISAFPASLNNSTSDFTTNVTGVVGELIPFSFLNTSTGPFTSVSFISTGIVLTQSGNLATGSIVLDVANIQQPLTVTLLLLGPDSVVLESVTQTVTFTILPRAIARLNGNNNDFTTTSSGSENATLNFSFTNNSVGTYDTFEWSSTGITLVGTGETVTASKVLTFPGSSATVTLLLFRNLVEVDRVTQTINFDVLQSNNSAFNLDGFYFSKKINDGILSTPIHTNGISAFSMFSYPFYPLENFRDYSYTRPSFTTRQWTVTSSLTGVSTLGNGTQAGVLLPVTFPNGATSNRMNIVMRTFDIDGIENGLSYMDLEFLYNIPVVSLDGNTSNYTTTTIASVGAVVPFTFTNTSTNILGSNQSVGFTSTGITLSGPLNSRSGSVTVVANQPPVTVTLRISIGSAFFEVGTVTRTINFIASDPLNNQVILSNAVALLDITPQPQSNVSNYSGIHVRWIPTAAGAPAQEPVNFKVQTLLAPVTASFLHYQGNNAATSTLTMSVDSTLSSPTSEEYVLGTSGQSIGESMSWNLNYLGSQTFTNQSVNEPSVIQFNQASSTSRFFDSLSMSVRTGTTKVFTTAYQCYLSNSNGISTASILANANYFIANEGRYVANQNGLGSVTFQLPVGNRVVAVISGGLLVNGVQNIYGHIHTGFQASLFNVTSRVVNNQITFQKVSGAQGSVIGFYVINLT